MNWKFSFVFISRIVPRLLMKIVLEYLGNTFRPFSHLKSLRILTLTFFLHISCFPMVKARRIVRGDAQKRPLRWSKNTAGTGRRKGSLPRFELGFFWFHLNRMGNLFGRTQGYGIWFLIGFFRFFGMGTSQNFCELWICGFVALRVFFSIAKHWGKRFSGFFQCKDMQTLINDWSTYPP